MLLLQLEMLLRNVLANDKNPVAFMPDVTVQHDVTVIVGLVVIRNLT